MLLYWFVSLFHEPEDFVVLWLWMLHLNCVFRSWPINLFFWIGWIEMIISIKYNFAYNQGPLMSLLRGFFLTAFFVSTLFSIGDLISGTF